MQVVLAGFSFRIAWLTVVIAFLKRYEGREHWIRITGFIGMLFGIMNNLKI
jgi:hypothetical protein